MSLRTSVTLVNELFNQNIYCNKGGCLEIREYIGLKYLRKLNVTITLFYFIIPVHKVIDAKTSVVNFCPVILLNVKLTV